MGEMRSHVSQEEGAARYFMQFTNEVQHMMKYLSSEPEVTFAAQILTVRGIGR